MAIVAATQTSFAEEVETEPDLEPDPELHLRGLAAAAANVKRQTSRRTAKRASGPATPAGTSYRDA
jgi:hypothetical protein